MKLNKHIPSSTIFLNYKKEQMKIKSLFALSKENSKSNPAWWKYAIE